MRDLLFPILLPSHFLPSKAQSEMHVKPRNRMHNLKSCSGRRTVGRRDGAKSLKSWANSDDGHTHANTNANAKRQTALHPAR